MPPRLPPALALETLSAVGSLLIDTGALIAAGGDGLRAQTPKDGVDLVTRADATAEAAIAPSLARQFPHHRVACEEGTVLGPEDSPWTWHLDPLDGTANYSRGIPYWAISLGLAHGREPVLGVIHGPACGMTVSGALGLGAWHGEAPLPEASPAGAPSTWIVATDWPWAVAKRPLTSRLLDALAPHIRQYKTMGSAALDLAMLVTGRVDAYFISDAFVWDLAGGSAIARAAGFELRTWSGAAWDLSHRDLAACRPGMWESLIAMAGSPLGPGA